jgi:hypothetical protein
MLLVVSARVRLLADYLWESVEPKIRAALQKTLGFERRELGQDVTYAEVVSAIQAVPGVSYVDLDFLDAVDEKRLTTFLNSQREKDKTKALKHLDLKLESRIIVLMASCDTDSQDIRPAQIAYLSPDVRDTLVLTELT